MASRYFAPLPGVNAFQVNLFEKGPGLIPISKGIKILG